ATRPHNALMEDVFTALRTGAGATAALAAGAVPDRGGAAGFRCAVAHTAAAPIANPSQPRRTVNFYELVPRLHDGRPLEPGTPLGPGVWVVSWTCPSYPAAHGGPATGAFHIGVGVGEGDLPPAWARNAAGAVAGAPGNVAVPCLPRVALVAALRRLAADGARAEREGCRLVAPFVAAKAARVRNGEPAVFDREDAQQEGMARLVVLMRRFAARGRPRACWSVAAGLVLERDLPRAADRVSHLPSNVAHCAHWLARTDLVDHHDPHLTPEAAAAAYAHDQRRRRRDSPRTRSWLRAGEEGASHPPEVWRLAILEARRGRPVSLDRLLAPHAGDPAGTSVGDLVPVVDRDVALVGERRLLDLVEDLLAGTGLGYEDVRAWLHPRLARREYPDAALGGPPAGPPARTPRQARDAAENRLLALVARHGESLTRHRAVLRRRVREVLFDDGGRFRPTEERRRRWQAARAQAAPPS
ncbi:MAG TPA: hypothetical protein VFZ77_18295, partial [Acidimicrobiales bacterium]